MTDNTYKFLAAWADLMEQYDITAIEAEDEYAGYPECGRDIQIRIDDPASSGFGPGFGECMDAEKIRAILKDQDND